MAQTDSKYDDVLKGCHINPEHTRFELHRVVEVPGNVKSASAPYLRPA